MRFGPYSTETAPRETTVSPTRALTRFRVPLDSSPFSPAHFAEESSRRLASTFSGDHGSSNFGECVENRFVRPGFPGIGEGKVLPVLIALHERSHEDESAFET